MIDGIFLRLEVISLSNRNVSHIILLKTTIIQIEEIVINFWAQQTINEKYICTNSYSELNLTSTIYMLSFKQHV